MKRTLYPAFAVLGISAVLLVPVMASAQATDAVVTGRTTDSTDAVVPGATVTLTSLGTQATVKAVTGQDGLFSIQHVTPGTYRVVVVKEGFRSQVNPRLVVHTQDRLVLNFKLTIGEVSQVVTVNAGDNPIDTQDATVSTLIDRHFVGNMPLNGRSFQALITLTPGVVTTAANSNSPGQFSINGQRPDSNYFTVDGVSANVGVATGGSILAGASGSGVASSGSGAYNNLVSIDAMQEFRIQTSTFAPEFGRTPGGQISITTRSGTNSFHGDIFEYLRNNDLDANDWFLNAAKQGHPAERQNDFGGVLGGPIWKNRLFFFFSYEGLRLNQPILFSAYVPSVLARTTAPAAVQPYMNAFPLPSPNGCAGVLGVSSDPNLGPFCQAYPSISKMDATSVRLDYSINSKMKVFGRWDKAPSTFTNRTLGSSLNTINANLLTYTAGFTYAIGPHFADDLHFNYTFDTGYGFGNVDNFGGAVPPTEAETFPGSIPDIGTVGPNNSQFIFILSPATQWRVGETTHNQAHQTNWLDNVSFDRGAHQFKTGFDFRRLTPVQARVAYQQTYSFVTTAALESGIVSTYSPTENPLSRYLWHNLDLYAQDTWKATSRISLTYGVRWADDPPPGTLNNVPFLALNQVDANNPSGTIVQPIGTPLYHTPLSEFAPRIGIAYQIRQNTSWESVLRGGLGIFYDTTGDAIVFSSTLAGANSTYTNIPFPVTNAQLIPAPATNAAPYPNTNSVDPDLRLPRVYQMNLALQQAVGANQSLTLTYAGAIGRKLFVQQAFPAQPPSTPSGISLPNGYIGTVNLGSSNYQSLQLLFQRRLINGLQAMASYVWSHSIDTGSIGAYRVPYYEPLSDERGPSDFDVRQAFQIGVSYSTPSFKNHAWVERLAGDWGSDFMFRARTSPPINVIDSATDFSGIYPYEGINLRPNLVPGQPIYLRGAACAAAFGVRSCPGGFGLNKAAFAKPTCQSTSGSACLSDVQGTLGRNALISYGWNQLDLSLHKGFPIHGQIALQFRSDIFNVMNHPSFYFSPGSNSLNLNNGAFGKTTTMLNNGLGGSGAGQTGYSPLYQIGGARSIQLALKLLF